MTGKTNPTGKIQGIIVLMLILGLIGFAVWKNRQSFEFNPPQQKGKSEIPNISQQQEKADQEAKLKTELEKAQQAEQQRLAQEEQLKRAQGEQARLEQERTAQEQLRREEEDKRIAQARQEERESVLREVERERADREAQEKARREEAAAKLLEQLKSLPYGQIQNIWIEENVSELSKQGLRIHVKFTVNNLQYKDCQIAAFFEFSSGKPLRDFNDLYKTTDGYVAVQEPFRPIYTNTSFEDVALFIPYEEMHLGPGKQDLRFMVKLYRVQDGYSFAQSSYYQFTAKVRNASERNRIIDFVMKRGVNIP